MAGPRHGIHSMTGYGRATHRTGAGSVTVEIRSTNHRYLEVESRLPNGLAAMQGRLGEVIRGHIRRGRVEATVMVQANHADQRRVVWDERLLSRYHTALQELKNRFGVKGPITLEHLLALPQALTIVEERSAPEQLWEPIRQTAGRAIAELVRSRQREGTKLVADLRTQLDAIARHAKAIKRRLPKALAQQRQDVRKRLQELLGGKNQPSASQLEQAAALVKDVDIHEELVRLESHLAYMRETLAGERLVGKRLDFIAQELMREANTLGAKVNDAAATQDVVEIKGRIEKIREQVQNLE